MKMKTITLQKIDFSEGAIDNGILELYYRGDSALSKDYLSQGYEFGDDSIYEFNTFFNALPVEQWRKYTIADDFCLEFDASGKFVAELFGYYIDDEERIQKEWLGNYSFNLFKQQHVILVHILP